MSDLIERLRSLAVKSNDGYLRGPALEAADHIEAQAAEIERLREALVRLRDCDWVISLPDRMDAVRDIARAALEGKT